MMVRHGAIAAFSCFVSSMYPHDDAIVNYLKDTKKDTSNEKAMEVFGSSCAACSNTPESYIYGQVLPSWNSLKNVTYVHVRTFN